MDANLQSGFGFPWALRYHVAKGTDFQRYVLPPLLHSVASLLRWPD